MSVFRPHRMLKSTGSPLVTLLVIVNLSVFCAVFLLGWPMSTSTVHCSHQVDVHVDQYATPSPPLPPPAPAPALEAKKLPYPSYVDQYATPSPAQRLPYPFCDTCGPDDLLCQQYGAVNLARSRAYEGSNVRLRRVLRDAERGRPIKVAIIGGSVSNGHGVKPEQNWPNVFGAWWRGTFPRSALTLQNGAVPATGSNYFSMCFGEHIDADPDLVIVELAVNDQRMESNTESFEWLMRVLLELPSRPAVVNAQVFGLAYSLLSTGGDLHTAVAQYYDIPTVSLRNVALPTILADPALDRHWFVIGRMGEVDHRHIGVNGHQALADLLAAYVQRQLCAMHADDERYTVPALDSVLPGRDDELDVVPRLRMMEPWDSQSAHPPLTPFCMSTRTQRHQLIPAYASGWEQWTFQGNRVKPYVRATEPGARVSFNITVGAMGRVRITYLKSAEFGLGTVLCWIDEDVQKGVKVQGHWDYKGLNIANVFVVARGVEDGAHTLTCELLEETGHPGGGTEFRLIAVDAA